jgi:hypothetical protein
MYKKDGSSGLTEPVPFKKFESASRLAVSHPRVGFHDLDTRPPLNFCKGYRATTSRLIERKRKIS